MKEDNIKMALKEIKWVAWTGFFRLRIQTVCEFL
jgi:hypothetical protein